MPEFKGEKLVMQSTVQLEKFSEYVNSLIYSKSGKYILNYGWFESEVFALNMQL